MGEYIIPVDLVSGEQSGRPQPVRNPVPEALVFTFDPETETSLLSWEAVPGATDYALWASDDGIDFYDTGLRTTENYIEMPLPPVEKQFYYITANH